MAYHQFLGKFDFPSQVFNFGSFTDGEYITFDQFEEPVETSYGQDATKIVVTHLTGVNVKIETYVVGGTMYTINTNESQLNQELDLLFNGDLETIGRISTNEVDAHVLYDLEHLFDISVNCIFLYKMNSSKNTVSKDLSFVRSGTVKFTRPINYKNLILDIEENVVDSSIFQDYNYVYLTSLKRYYFVVDKTMTNKYSILTLREDVLMSFSDLIRSQTAFVERNANDYDLDKVDSYIYYDYDKSISYSGITPTNNVYDYLHQSGTGTLGYWVMLGVA